MLRMTKLKFSRVKRQSGRYKTARQSCNSKPLVKYPLRLFVLPRGRCDHCLRVTVLHFCFNRPLRKFPRPFFLDQLEVDVSKRNAQQVPNAQKAGTTHRSRVPILSPTLTTVSKVCLE